MTKIERFQQAYDYLYSKGVFHSKTECAKRLGRTRTNISGAYYGREPFFNDRFLASFCREFTDINQEWLIDGKGEMINKQKPTAQDGLIELYAQLIRRVDDLRTELAIELESVRQEREQLAQLIQQFNAVLTHQPASYKQKEPDHLMAAEPSKNPNKSKSKSK